MAIDGYFISVQINEFKSELIGAKLRKITSESLNSISLEFFHSGKHHLLFDVSPNSPHMRLATEPVTSVDSNFLNVLKKEILNSTLISIYQHGKDRIVLFKFLKNDPFYGPLTKTLIFEVMGRNSNLILIDENYLIIDSIKKIFNEDKRSVLPNIKYEFYPSSKKVFIYNDLLSLNTPADLFYNYMGFSKDFAEYIFNNKLNPDTLDVSPTIYKSKKIIFHAYDLNLDGEKISFKDTSSLLKYYYELTTKSDDFLIKLLLKQQKRLNQKLNNLNTEFLKNKDYETIKQIADSIYMSGLDLNKRYDTFNSFPLDNTLSLNDNAQKLYKDYKRLKGSLDFLNSELLKTTEELGYYTDLIANYHTFNKNDLADLRLELAALGLFKEKKIKQKHEKKYLIHKLKNATVIVGKTAKQNEEIFAKFTEGEDYWFHVKDYPGAHVILKGEKTEENMLFAAKEALLNSPLSKAMQGYVNYTKVKYVKKTTKRVGFYVTFKNGKTLFVTL